MLPVVYAPQYEVDLGAHVFPTDKWRRAFEMLQPQLQAAQMHQPQISAPITAAVATSVPLSVVSSLLMTTATSILQAQPVQLISP